MSLLELLLLSIALGTDLFSVAVPIGMNPVRGALCLRAAVVFALFHIIMILAGYHVGHWLGFQVERLSVYHTDAFMLIQNWTAIGGALVLTGLGISMIREGLSSICVPDKSAGHVLQGSALLLLALSVSVDALAAGFSLGMLDVDLYKLSFILGIVIFLIAVAGLSIGKYVGGCVGRRAGLLGGIVLILLGIHVFYTL